MRKVREKISIFAAKSPQKAVLVGIMLFNFVFIVIAAAVISILSQYLDGMSECTFWVGLYRTITMVLDAGCIESIIADVGKAGAVAAIVCLLVIILGMIFFTGAVIGYVTNVISDFIDSKNNGRNKLVLSDHVVIVNWNSRGTEIINEFLYENRSVTIVVFVPDNREEIREEIRNRLDTTLMKEAQQVYEAARGMSFFEKKKYLRENLIKDNITCIVREGDVAAATDLDDICISKARAVVILNSEICEGSKEARIIEKGNTQTIKTLIQVSEISKGNADQIILVEVADYWTEALVGRIIDFRGEGMEKILPISYNRLLGVTYAQIAIMPEMNEVYDILLSNKGVQLLSQGVADDYPAENERMFMEQELAGNCCSIPLAIIDTMNGKKAFFMANSESDLEKKDSFGAVTRDVKLKNNYTVRKRNIVVLGHNSSMDSLMEGFDSFVKEWYQLGSSELIKVVMVDDRETLEKHDYYKAFPYVEALEADVYDYEIINGRIRELCENVPEETTVLILSDDLAENEDVDAYALTYLIYIQEQIHKWKKENPGFRREKIDVVVEILNPKNEDVVRNYGADSVIISNKYLSHVVSQLSFGKAIYEFIEYVISNNYNEDDDKDVYIIPAGDFFEEIPGKCTAYELIRMVFEGSASGDRSMILGYVRNEKEYVIFGGDQRKIEIELEADDKLIVFGGHKAILNGDSVFD